MKKNKKKDEFLDHLRKIPIVQVACEKSAISRNSVYRWRNEDKEFSQKMEEALAEGEALINDMSESQLLSLIKDKNWQSISFWLRHRHPKYKDKIELSGTLSIEEDELSEEEAQIVAQALNLVNPPTEIKPPQNYEF